MTTNNTSRIELVDALRGYALMGLFMVHMVEYYELLWYSPPAKFHPITATIFALFSGKAYAMFGMLFGLSFYIILQRNADRGVDFRLRFIWRVVLLFLIGYLHGLIYTGEVLQILAIAGLLLVPLWFAPTWLLLSISSLLLLQITSFGFIAWIHVHHVDYQQPFFVAIEKLVYPIYAHGTLGQMIVANAAAGTESKWLFMLESGRFANIVGLSLLGFWLGKVGFFIDTKKFGRTYLPLLLMCVGAVIACYFLVPAFASIGPDNVDDLWTGIMEMYSNTLLMFCTVLMFVLLYQYQPIQKILRYLAAPGRMTLSLYVGQSLLMVPVFYHFGLGAYRWIGPWTNLSLAIALWVIQIVAARWWLNKFHYGPLEWCWRAATYGTTKIAFRRTFEH